MRRHPGMLAALASCLAACSSPNPPADRAVALVAAARRAIGPAADSIRTIAATATVTGPERTFVAEVASARDGRVRLSLAGSLGAGVSGPTAWLCDSAGVAGPLDSATLTLVRGHALHMLALAPTAWLGNAVVGDRRTWGSDSVVTLRFRDALGAPLLMFLRTTDSLPVGFAIVNHSRAGLREVGVYLSEWEQRPGLRLFRRAVFTQGADRYVYEYTSVEVNRLGDTAFSAACPRGG